MFLQADAVAAHPRDAPSLLRPPSVNAQRTLFFIALGLFGLYSVEFGVVGILPSIIARYDISIAQAGALVSLFALIVAICGPFMVLLLSGLDRRRLLAGSLAAFAVCSLLSAWAPNFLTLMLLRVPSALLHPVFFSVAFSCAISLYPPHRATHATAMAFVGTSMGMVMGVPLTTWVEARFSYEGSFLMCGLINAVAAAGLWWMLPSATTSGDRPRVKQLEILGSAPMWLAIGMTVCVFGAGFSVYSFAAAYLAHETGLGGQQISLLLVVFGCGGVLGNLVAGRLLGHFRKLTVLLYPVAVALAYAILLEFGSRSITAMLPVCLFWGAAHTSGLVVSQVWLTSAAPPEAHAFATSIYLSAANVGIVLGASLGGAFITSFGLRAALWSGWILAVLTLLFAAARVLLDQRSSSGNAATAISSC